MKDRFNRNRFDRPKFADDTYEEGWALEALLGRDVPEEPVNTKPAHKSEGFLKSALSNERVSNAYKR